MGIKYDYLDYARYKGDKNYFKNGVNSLSKGSVGIGTVSVAYR
jgi:hypothetical protein